MAHNRERLMRDRGRNTGWDTGWNSGVCTVANTVMWLVLASSDAAQVIVSNVVP